MKATTLEPIRDFLIKQPFKIADETKDILSLNFVGSFSESQGLADISDIDIVVIVDFLTKSIFEKILNKFEEIAPVLNKKYGLKLKINSSFGPLKFNDENTVVYHVMIYDVFRHILHCQKSPFTCYDWERTKLYRKKHIAEIYPIYRLMPNYFFNARRGVKEYLHDFAKSSISYREYTFTSDGEVSEKTCYSPMTTKDQYEFAFHIVKFLMLNFIKLVEAGNVYYRNEVLIEQFRKYLSDFDDDINSWFVKLLGYKKSNRYPENLDDLYGFIENFLKKFERYFNKYFSLNDKYVFVCRHAKTDLNQGTTFLGQKLDPHIIKNDVLIEQSSYEFDKVVISPTVRSAETVTLITSCSKITKDPLLSEVNYGEAEGKDLEWLREYYPEIIQAWDRGDDIAFPSGESLNDIRLRVEKFISLLPGSNRLLIITHNVWLRALIGISFRIPMRDWYKINIPHNYLFEFRFGFDGKLYPNFKQEDLSILFEKYETEKLKSFYKDYYLDIKERYLFWNSVYEKQKEIKSNNHLFYDCDCLIPVAGDGKRFRNEGFMTPKPLIKVDDNSIIVQTVNCLPRTKKIVYVIKSDLLLNDGIRMVLEKTSEHVEFISVDQTTEGQACTCLLGIDKLDLNKPLLIAPCDNGMIWDDEKLLSVLGENNDIICWTFTKHFAITSKPEAWGYVKVDEQNNAIDVSVKKPFSDNPYLEHCIIGTFWFKSGKFFRDIAAELIDCNIRVSNEFYVDSVVGLAIKKGYKVKIFDVDQYISWGRPEDLYEYNKWMGILKLLKHRMSNA